MNHAKLFLRSLIRLYGTACRETVQAFIFGWSFLFIHILLLFAGSALVGVAGIFPAPFASIFLGFFSACILSGYWVTVRSALFHERVSFAELAPRAQSIFPRILGLLCFLFLITLVVRAFTTSVEVLLSANLCIAISWNTMFETAYQSDDDTLTTIRRSWGFITENAFEWFLPSAIVIALTSVTMGTLAWIRLTVLLFATHPVQLLELLFRAARTPTFDHIVPVFIGLVLVYAVFLFRGSLYRQLAKSNRRKRIFDENFS